MIVKFKRTQELPDGETAEVEVTFERPDGKGFDYPLDIARMLLMDEVAGTQKLIDNAESEQHYEDTRKALTELLPNVNTRLFSALRWHFAQAKETPTRNALRQIASGYRLINGVGKTRMQQLAAALDAGE